MISKIDFAMPGVSFGAHYVSADIGASTKNGSFKIKALNEAGKVIAESKSTIFKDGEPRSEEGFEANVAARVADFEQTNKAAIMAEDPDNETKLTVCYPGPKIMSKNNAYEGIRLTNFYYDDDRKNVFNRPINTDTIDSILKQKGVNLVRSFHVNDMAATGTSVLNRLKEQYPEVLQKGREILFLYPGGGLGSGVIMVDDDNINIKPTEKQHAISSGTSNIRGLEKDVHSPGLISNYAAALGVDKAKIGENTMAVDNYKEARKIFPNLTENEHNEASVSAIKLYMESLSQIIARQICDAKTNTVVLTGPIANGIKQAVNNLPDKYWQVEGNKEDDKFSAYMKKLIRDNLSLEDKSIPTVGHALMGQDKDFTVIVLPNLDNTSYSYILHKGGQVGKPAAWYNIRN